MNLLHESKLTLRLAFPLVIGQLSQMLLGVADTVMIGKLGVTDLAALNFANALFHVPFIFGIGLLTAISVLTSNARGAGDTAAARGSCRHGLFLSVALGALLFAAGWAASNRLEWFGQPPVVAARSVVFLRIVMASLIPGLMAIALKNHADALDRPWPPFWIFLGGVLLNIGLNWVLIYGKMGAPALGFEGAAWATLIARSMMVVAMLGWLMKAADLREWVPFRWFRAPDWSDIRRLMTIGFPASLHMLTEVGAFSAAGLIMGRFGQVAMAAHQITITCTATAFMIPLGLAMALTVRIAQAHGAGETSRLRPIVISGWLLGGLSSLTAAAVFWFFGNGIASLFVDAPAVVSLTASLLVIVAVFQLADTVQVSSVFMLRGLHDARVPAVVGFVAYWVVGLPVAAFLGFRLQQEAVGVWWGLAAGLMVACLLLGPRLWRRTAPVAAGDQASTASRQ